DPPARPVLRGGGAGTGGPPAPARADAAGAGGRPRPGGRGEELMSGRIVIDPTELRRGATRIRDASSELSVAARSLGSLSMPEMPAGVAGEVEAGIASVSSQLQGMAPTLSEDAVELERRAVWAEIADRLQAGYPLEASQLREFLAWMKDGSLLRYATEEQAGLAGGYVGAMYRDRFKHPQELFDLAQILHASQQNAY